MRMSDTLYGRPERQEYISHLTPGQQGLHQNYLQAIQGRGAGGATGAATDYYRDLLDPSGQTAQQMSAPMMRQFQEETIPGLSHQFAGLGSGALSSSSFRNAGVRAGTDLAERLGSMRAQLRQQGAQGLMGAAQGGLGQVGETVVRPKEQGLMGGLAQGAGEGVGTGAALWGLAKALPFLMI